MFFKTPTGQRTLFLILVAFALNCSADVVSAAVSWAGGCPKTFANISTSMLDSMADSINAQFRYRSVDYKKVKKSGYVFDAGANTLPDGPGKVDLWAEVDPRFVFELTLGKGNEPATEIVEKGSQPYESPFLRWLNLKYETRQDFNGIAFGKKDLKVAGFWQVSHQPADQYEPEREYGFVMFSDSTKFDFAARGLSITGRYWRYLPTKKAKEKRLFRIEITIEELVDDVHDTVYP